MPKDYTNDMKTFLTHLRGDEKAKIKAIAKSKYSFLHKKSQLKLRTILLNLNLDAQGIYTLPPLLIHPKLKKLKAPSQVPYLELN